MHRHRNTWSVHLRTVALTTGMALFAAGPALAESHTLPERAREAPKTEASAPRTGAALPERAAAALAGSRIVVHLRDVGDSLAASLVEVLEGLDPAPARVETRFVDVDVATDQVRYFHASDEAAAAAVAAHLGQVFDTVAVRDFRAYAPSPSPGLIEVWVR